MRKPVLLFVTRKWDGYGGMQRLSQDLWRGMCEAYGERAQLCALQGERYWLWRSVFLGFRTVWCGGHVHLGDAALAPLGWFLKKVWRGQVTVTACGLDVVWPCWWYQWMLRRTLPTMDRVVCISRATAEAVWRGGVSEEKIVVIPCGVWTDVRNVAIASLAGAMNPNYIALAPACLPAGSRRMAPFLLTVGRLVPRKGVPWFVHEVVPILLHDFPHLQYWIIGSGPQELLIKKFVQEKGLWHCVHLVGELDDAQREEFFSQADFCVMPSVSVPGDMEGFGIACIEASVRGIPVVAARLEGLQDAVKEGVTGRFFKPGNVGECVKVIREMLAEGEDGRWEREHVARATLEHYGWPQLFQRYRDEVFGF